MRTPSFVPALLLLACRPSQADVDALSAQLAAVHAQQAAIMQRLETGGAPAEGSGHDHTQLIERVAALGDGLEMVHRRLDEVESRLESARPVAQPTPSVRPGRPDPAARYRVALADAHVRGKDDALVTIVAWVDYQCPFSARVQATLDDVAKNYGVKVRIVAKHNPLPFHKRAMAAALAAEAAGRQGKFWEMHAKLFANQRALEDDDLKAYARKLKLDLERFRRDMKDEALKQKIVDAQAQGNRLGANGTPAFFINGRFLSGAQPLPSFEALIDEELAVAQELTRRGIAKARVYDELMAEARAGLD